eukprot:1544299-Amphidinium_carterae.3
MIAKTHQGAWTAIVLIGMHSHLIIVIEHHGGVVMPGTLRATPGQFMYELQSARPLLLPSMVGHSESDLGVQTKEAASGGGSSVKKAILACQHSSSSI